MTHANPQPSAAATARKLPPVAAPAEVADSGLIRIGAAVGHPVRR
jgi:hypothetical protein